MTAANLENLSQITAFNKCFGKGLPVSRAGRPQRTPMSCCTSNHSHRARLYGGSCPSGTSSEALLFSPRRGVSGDAGIAARARKTNGAADAVPGGRGGRRPDKPTCPDWVRPVAPLVEARRVPKTASHHGARLAHAGIQCFRTGLGPRALGNNILDWAKPMVRRTRCARARRAHTGRRTLFQTGRAPRALWATICQTG